MKTPNHTLPDVNRQIILRRRPMGSPVASDFASTVAVVPKPEAGAFLVRNHFVALDPVQRGWAVNPSLVALGAPMRSLAVGIVIESRDPEVAVGTMAYGYFGWQDYAVGTRQDLLYRTAEPQAPLADYAGMLGMPGATAWLALTMLAPPRAGQTVLVSTAAGTVGRLVGQIARKSGARVIGLTGSDEKARQCKEHYGYELALDYRRDDVDRVLSEVCPAGIDIFFDNTGGSILDIAIRRMARFGRIIQCGTAATSSWDPAPQGLRNEREVLLRSLTWTGFVIFDHLDRFSEAVARLTALAQAGEIVCPADPTPGLGLLPEAAEALFRPGSNPPRLFDVSNHRA